MDNLRQRKKNDRNQRIQNAALNLFGSQGFQKTSISQIAEKANLGVGTIYNYYKSKEEILFSIIQDRSNEYVEQLDKIINNSNNDIQGSISAFIDVYLKSFSIYNKKIWCEIIGAGFSMNLPILTLVDKVDQIFLNKFSELLNEFQRKGVMRNDIKVKDIVSIIYSLMISKILRYISNEKMVLIDLKNSLNKQIKIILKIDF